MTTVAPRGDHAMNATRPAGLGLFNPTIAALTARALFGRRQLLILIPLPLLVIGLSLVVSRGFSEPPEHWVTPVVVNLGIKVMLPVIALIIGSGVLGSEIDDGTLAHILAKPLPRREIIFSKLVVAVPASAVAAGVPLALVGLIADSRSLAGGLLVGSLVGSLCYCALFTALSLLTRHPVLIGLGYVLVWEALLTSLISGTQAVSIQEYVIAVVRKVAGNDLVTAHVSLATSLSMGFIVTVGFTLLAIDRLRSFSVQGETS
jgi:ABC-2 type transport system permease protein